MWSDIKSILKKFVKERDWDKFHSLENLAKSISIESAELLECYQWSGESDLSVVKAELADVLTYSYLMCIKLGVDPEAIVLEKLELTKNKYPINKSYGVSTKYDKF